MACLEELQQLRFGKLLLEQHPDEKMFGHNVQSRVWIKPNTAYHHEHLIPTVKHGGGGVAVWAWFAVADPGRLAVTKLTMSSSVYPLYVKYSRVKSLLTAKSWPQFGHTACDDLSQKPQHNVLRGA